METESEVASTDVPSAAATQVLKCVSLGAAVLLWRHQVHRNNYRSPSGGPRCTLLHLAQAVILVFIFLGRLRRGLPSSGFCCALCGMLSVSAFVDLVRHLERLNNLEDIQLYEFDSRRSVMVASVLLTFSTAGSFLSAGLQDSVVAKSTASTVTSAPKNEDDTSVFGRMTSAVLFPLFREILRGSKETDPVLPRLRRGMKCKELVTCLDKWLNRGNKDTIRRRVFIKSIIRVLWVDVLRVTICTLAYYGCLFTRVPALELLMASSQRGDLIVAAVLLVSVSAAEFLISCYHMDLLILFSGRMRAMLQGAIFRKATQMPGSLRSTYPTGSVVSLLAVDCGTLAFAMVVFPMPLGGLLTLPGLLWLLSQRTGTMPTLCCLLWIVAVFVMPFTGFRLQKRFWQSQMKAREERIKTLSDLFVSIRTVKMYGWEDALQASVQRLRKVEVSWLFKANLLDGILDSFYTAASSVLAIILFSALYFFEPDIVLTPALSFSCVYLVYVTDLTLSSTGLLFRNGRQVALGLGRISAFCTEMDEHKHGKRPVEAVLRKPGCVSVEKCCFSWSSPREESAQEQLKDVTLHVPPGSLVAVVGFVGSGKSSLLSAILGEMPCTAGSVVCTGRVAYVPQLAHVYNVTIRDNILYGREMDDERYDEVLQCCKLLDDLSKLPAGDLTEVGEKGGNLSGGQKQRISLARAAFSNSDIYLLDDPLSAVDAAVGNSIFDSLLGKSGLLRNKTRIMVCNQGAYLHHMDKIVLVHDGRVREYDCVDDLLADPDSPETLREATRNEGAISPKEKGTQAKEGKGNESAGRVTEKEQQVSTYSSLSLMWALMRFSGWPAMAALVMFSLGAAALTLEHLWIKQWTDAYASDTTPQPAHGLSWIEVLVSFCVLDVLCRVVGGVLLAVSSRKLSERLHGAMLAHVLASPVSLFDSCPRGRMLNRFSADMDFVDSRTFMSGKQTVQRVLFTAAQLAIVASQSPRVLAVGAGVAVVVVFGVKLAVRASYRARFFESAVLSQLLAHVTEMLESLSSVRAYGVVGRACDRFCRLADANTRGYTAFCDMYKFTRFVTSACSLVLVLAALLLNVVLVDRWDASRVGLAMSAASTVPVAMMYLCVLLFNILQMVVSFERCLEYSQLPEEHDVALEWTAEKKASVVSLLRDWPTEGGLTFEDYSASYRPGVLPDVLSCVSFHVRPLEKVGILGRTGAGKSSLVMAILRVLKASHGRILIDGVDIADVPLKKLRRSITVIPQDPSLLRGTLRMNVDPSDSYSDDEVWKALGQAHLDHLANASPHKLLMEVGDGGTNLSVGQRQLVCLARALLRNTRLLLLDEATSQIDGDTDQLIQATLRQSFAKCTLLTIAHRLHTVLDCDRILVMENGKVREFGAVSALLKRPSSAFYAMASEAGLVAGDLTSCGMTTAL
ncbi:multidrug resistance protein mrp-7-like isoform X2 [Haemaphysalis longicornis]